MTFKLKCELKKNFLTCILSGNFFITLYSNSKVNLISSLYLSTTTSTLSPASLVSFILLISSTEVTFCPSNLVIISFALSPAFSATEPSVTLTTPTP